MSLVIGLSIIFSPVLHLVPSIQSKQIADSSDVDGLGLYGPTAVNRGGKCTTITKVADQLQLILAAFIPSLCKCHIARW